MKFLDNKILQEANLVCAFARADKILNDENSTREDLRQSRSFLMEIFGKLEKILAEVRDNEEVAWHPRLLQTIVHYMQGSLSFILGDLPHAENELKVSLMNLPSHVQCPVVLVTALSVYSELGRLYYRRKHLEEADKYFLMAVSAAPGTQAGPPPYSLQDLFTPGVDKLSPGGRREMESLVTEARQYLAMRGKMPGSETEMVARHEAFIGDFEKRMVTEEAGERCTELIKFFLETNNFQFARKYLCLSDVIMERNKEMNENEKQRLFIFCKLEYYLNLMKTSAEKIQERKRVTIGKKKEQNLEKFQLSTNCRNAILQFERHYLSIPAKDWKEAKAIFSQGTKHFNLALTIFSFEENCLDRVKANQMLSKMYKHLAAFKVEKVNNNDNLDRVCKMLWRRIKCLEICLPFLDPETHIIQVQEVTFELADIYLELLEMKQKKFEKTAGNLDPTLLKKMSYYCLTGVKHCDAFLLTLGADTVTYTEDMVRPAIIAMFRRAKFYNKIFTPIGDDQVRFTQLAIAGYQRILDYCAAHPHHRRLASQEHAASLDTVDLLQRQLKMHAQAKQQIQ